MSLERNHVLTKEWGINLSETISWARFGILCLNYWVTASLRVLGVGDNRVLRAVWSAVRLQRWTLNVHLTLCRYHEQRQATCGSQQADLRVLMPEMQWQWRVRKLGVVHITTPQCV